MSGCICWSSLKKVVGSWAQRYAGVHPATPRAVLGADFLGWVPIVPVFAAVFGTAVPLQAQLVRGQVVDSVTGAPVPEAIVVLIDPRGSESDRSVSDRRGYYLLRAPSSGTYQLMVEKEGYRRSAFSPFVLEAGEMLSHVLRIASLDVVSAFPDRTTMELAAAVCPDALADELAIIVGVVTDAVSGAPAAGVQVHLSMPPTRDRERSVAQREIAKTDDKGVYFVCRAPVMSRISVHAVDADRFSNFNAVLFGTTGVFTGGVFRPLDRLIWRQDLELYPMDQRGVTLTGSVSDTSGNALSGATVEIVGTPHRTRTDATGRFEFSHLTHGDVRVQAKQIGYSPAEFDVDLAPGQAVHVPNDILTLRPFPTRLRDIIVTGEAGGYGAKIEGFLLRRETEPRGRFGVPADWATMNNPTLGKILEQIRAFRFQPRGCHGHVTFVDGIRLPPYVGVEHFVRLGRIVGVETYAQSIDAPVRYRKGGCAGVLLIWTR